MKQLINIYQAILKGGISTTRLSMDNVNSFGKIAVATSKDLMIMNRGFTVGAVETLMTNTKSATHWTPNVYKYLKRQNGIITGHEEKNLKQINTFVLDVDNENITYTDILSTGLELDFVPSLILKTDKGYHVYFILDQPIFVTAKTKFRSLNTAKYVSKNIRELFSKKIEGVDLTCNHFGYFRIPNQSNVVTYNENITYSFKDLMAWSKRYAEEKIINFETEKEMRRIDPNGTYIKQVKETWYRKLILQAKIYPKNGYGRNNAIFTLSLANYQSYVDKVDCLNKMEYFNELLQYPLSLQEIQRIVNSAYSGKYRGATKEYVESLTESWCGKKYTTSAFNHMVKHRKLRKDRKNSHAFEREQDIIKYLSENQKQGFVVISLRDLAKHFNISLNAIRNVLKQSKIIKTKTVGKGRYTITKIYTLQTLVQHVQNIKANTILRLSEINEVMNLLPHRLAEAVEEILKETRITHDRQAFKELRLLE